MELPCDQNFDDMDCDGIPNDIDLCPAFPGPHEGDMDCDDVPDELDLCIGQYGTEENCGCAIGVGPAPGDLLFRYGMPARFSLITGYASSEGKTHNFGHVGMYAGSFVADQEYPVLHKNGLKVYRQRSEGVYVVRTFGTKRSVC